MELKNRIEFELEKKFGNSKPTFPKEFYKIIKIGRITFWQYVRNEKQPTISELSRIADWLGVPPKELTNF